VPVSLVAKACSTALEALPDPQPGPMPDRDFLAKQLEDAWRQGPKATVECWHGVAARAEELCGGKLPAAIWNLPGRSHSAHGDYHRAPTESGAMAEQLADELEVALKSVPKPDAGAELAYWREKAERHQAEVAEVTAEQLRDAINAELGLGPPAPHPGPFTPEREVELRKKPAHYCVHELFPVLDQLRAELVSFKRERGDLLVDIQTGVNELLRLREQYEALRAACAWRGVGIYPVESAIKRCEDHGDLDAAAYIRRVQSALVSVMPEPRRAWQHTSSDGEAHTFRHSVTGDQRTLEGFATWQEAEAMLDDPMCAQSAPAEVPASLRPLWARLELHERVLRALKTAVAAAPIHKLALDPVLFAIDALDAPKERR
jgi:hypothetical protein